MGNSYINRLLSTILILTFPVVAQSTDITTSTHSQKSHVHGAAELTIAIENHRVEMQLISPAVNIIGFEHRPSTPQQQEQAEKAKNLLSDPDKLFRFKGSNCQIEKQEIHLPFADEPEHETHHNGHTHQKHDEHKEGHDSHDHHDSSHSEVETSYLFICKKAAPVAIYIGLLDYFPSIESLHVQWITDQQQGAKQLDGDSRWVNLR